MALPATDTFNRANANPIGGSWTTFTGCNALAIVSNACVGSTAAAKNAARWTGDTFNDDQYSQIVLGTIDTTNFVPCPAVRMSAVAETCYFAATNGSVVRIRKKINGGAASTLGADISATVSAGDTLKLAVTGTTLEAFVNGVSVGTRTDSGIASGSAGISSYDTTGTADSWEGGNVSAASSPSASVSSSPSTSTSSSPSSSQSPSSSLSPSSSESSSPSSSLSPSTSPSGSLSASPSSSLSPSSSTSSSPSSSLSAWDTDVSIDWTWSPSGEDTVTFWRIKYGTATGVYTGQYDIEDETARSVDLIDFLTLTDVYYLVVVACNGDGEGAVSNEIVVDWLRPTPSSSVSSSPSASASTSPSSSESPSSSASTSPSAGNTPSSSPSSSQSPSTSESSSQSSSVSSSVSSSASSSASTSLSASASPSSSRSESPSPTAAASSHSRGAMRVGYVTRVLHIDI